MTMMMMMRMMMMTTMIMLLLLLLMMMTMMLTTTTMMMAIMKRRVKQKHQQSHPPCSERCVALQRPRPSQPSIRHTRLYFRAPHERRQLGRYAEAQPSAAESPPRSALVRLREWLE